MKTQMTKTAWKVGFKNALICGFGVFAFVGVFALGISEALDRSLRDSVPIALSIFMALALVAVGVGWLSAQKKSGTVLLDCGPIPQKGLLLSNGVLFLLTGISISVFSTDLFRELGLAFAALCLMGSVFYFFMASTRIQARESGIWTHGHLLPWHKIQSYDWKEEGDSVTLLIQAKGRYPALERSAIPLPHEHKEPLDRLMTRYLAIEAKTA